MGEPEKDIVRKWIKSRVARIPTSGIPEWGGTSEAAADRFGLRALRHPARRCKPSMQIIAGALDDLSAVLGVPPSALGFWGTLTIEWGGDHHSTGPEFVPSSRTIRLTVPDHGDIGALAHEWFHALDHVALAQVLVRQEEVPGTLTEHCSVVHDHAPPESAEMLALVKAACEVVTALREHTRIEPRTRRLVELVEARPERWLPVPEQAARAFEQYIDMRLHAKIERGNDALVCFPRPNDLDSRDQLNSIYHYPTPEEARLLAPRLERMLSAARASGVLSGARTSTPIEPRELRK